MKHNAFRNSVVTITRKQLKNRKLVNRLLKHGFALKVRS